MLDLYHATRDELIRIIRDQGETIADQERMIAALRDEQAAIRQTVQALTAQLGAVAGDDADDGAPGAPKGMPGLKPTQAEVREPQPRKRRRQGYGRSRMAATEQVIHALDACLDCGAPLAGGSVTRTREVIDLPPPRIVVTAHVYLERRCPACGKRCVPPPDLGEQVTGQGRLGHGLTGLLGVLREEARLPVRVIQTLLTTLTGLHLCAGAIVAASQRLADRAQPVVAQVQDAIRASPVVHLDETGWRENGRNGYAWTASTPEHRLFVRGTRQKTMGDRLLGDAFAGVVVSDFYVAYTHDDRTHQYCWAHLLRDLHELVGQHPDEAAVAGWAAAVQGVFARAQAGATGTRADRWRVRKAAQADLTALCTPWLTPTVAQTTLCARILKFLESLFVFVTEPAVPATNNAAERSLRHLVVARKISGGTRSAAGTATRMTLASLFGTWRAQGINPYDATLDLLRSPQV